MSAAALLLIHTLCPPGEYIIREAPTVCWPCEAGYACVNGSRIACRVGEEWSGQGMTECRVCGGACGAGQLLVMRCNDGTSDRVCADCPGGFGCEDGLMRRCKVGTFSDNGVCVLCGDNRTTKASGSVSETECVCLGDNCTSACSEGQLAVGGECRDCPRGFGCDREDGSIEQCVPGTFSSPSGVCTQCGGNSHSAAGAESEDECACDTGYTRDSDRRCSPCKPGTVYSEALCPPCTPGSYCLGRMHHEPCPSDMFSHAGSAMCTACRMNSGCLSRGPDRMCTTQDNCTCDDGFVDHGGECRRCPAATMKPLRGDGCIQCPRGMECLGGGEVHSCSLSTFSTGNRSRCATCSACREITVARCNATHDSVCELTPYAIAIITLTQYYHTQVGGETFALFALVFASSLPKAQLVKVCSGSSDCVHCFQGQCPMSQMKRLASDGDYMYEFEVEIRSDAARLSTNVESLTQTAFLPELAKTTMSKLTDIPFTLRSRIEHSVLCPDEGKWDGGECVVQTAPIDASRTWLGLGVSVVLLALVGAWRSRRRWGEGSKITWAKVEELTEGE